MMRTAVLRLCGQASGGPSGLSAQSWARIRPASSLLPRKSLSGSLVVPLKPVALEACAILPRPASHKYRPTVYNGQDEKRFHPWLWP